MTDCQGVEFVGIVEYTEDSHTYDYCSLDIETKDLTDYLNLQRLGEGIARKYGESYRERITYETPENIPETTIGLRPKRYHKMSALEKDRLEKAVRRALEYRSLL